MTRIEQESMYTVQDLLKESTIVLPNGLEGANFSREGCLEQTVLPDEFSDAQAVFFVPTYNRQLSSDGREIGTFPHLVRDLIEASIREDKKIAILISDDSGPNQSSLNERVLNIALDGLRSSSPIYIVGQSERETMFTNGANRQILDSLLRREVFSRRGHIETDELHFHEDTMRFLILRGGYGPQRVRAHGMTMGFSQPIVSRDDDLRCLSIAVPSSLREEGESDGTPCYRFAFVGAEDACAFPIELDQTARFIEPSLETGLGSSLAELQRRHPTMRVFDRVHISKDRALAELLTQQKGIARFAFRAGAPLEDIEPRARVVSVTAQIWGSPDVNGHKALLNAVRLGRERLGGFGFGLGSLRTGDNGEYPGFIVKQTSNPACGIETGLSSELRLMIPWLVTNPEIGGLGGLLLSKGARAEDQLRTDSTDSLALFSYSNEILFHARTAVGRQENSVETFLSEDLGDLLAALVRPRFGFDGARNSWTFDTQGLYTYNKVGKPEGFCEAVVANELTPQIEAIWNRLGDIRLHIRESLSDGSPNEDTVRSIGDELSRRCTESYQLFASRALDYLLQQARFVESVFMCYPVITEGFEQIRKNAAFPARRWKFA